MSNHKALPNRFKLYLYGMFIVVVLLGLAFFVLLQEQRRYQKAIQLRELSLYLTEELRQSSTDLARLVRSYVITGNPVYRDYFNTVVEIREGHQRRPTNYSLAYWELKNTEGHSASYTGYRDGEAVALIELMRRAGFTNDELAKLIKAKASSDRLVEIEREAIVRVDMDSRNNQQRDLALSTLADEKFINLKAQVMLPIIETQQMVINRTQAAVDIAKRRLSISTLFLFLMTGALVVLTPLLGREIRRLIGCPMQDLQSTLDQLGRGDFLTPIKAKEPNSVLAWVASTQRQLATLNLMHFKAIVESSEDAIISKTTDSIVASWNVGAERIFGYSVEEMIGNSIRRIVPEDRAFEEDDILEKISRGEKVEHFQTQRQHRDGHLIDISVSISPIYSESGKIIGASKIARDITRIKAAEAEIQRLAFYDTLTGLANRRLLIDILSKNIDRYERDSVGFAVVFLDLDNFKTINDTLGHEAGDALLAETGSRLLGCLRKTDLAARLGGDEFVLLISPSQTVTPSDQWLGIVIEKVRESLALPYALPGGDYRCTTSIGGVIYEGQGGSALDLLRQADQAMYQAKRKGKNQFHIFDRTVPETKYDT